MTNPSFIERVAKITEQRNRLAATSTAAEKKIEQKAANDCSVVSDEVRGGVKSPERKLSPMMKQLLEKNKDDPTYLDRMSQNAKTNLKKKLLAKQAASKKRNALSAATVKAQEQDAIDLEEDDSAGRSASDDSPADPEITSSPEVISIPQYAKPSLRADDKGEGEEADDQECAGDADDFAASEDQPTHVAVSAPQVQSKPRQYPSEDDSCDLTSGAPTVRSLPTCYPVHAFGSFAPMVRLVSEILQVSPEMVGSCLLGILSAIAQAIINVSFKASGDGCPVTLNLFIMAGTGERKSTTIKAIAKPLYEALKTAVDERGNMIIQDVTVDGMIVGLINGCPAQTLLVLEGASLLGGHAMAKDNLSRFLGNVSSLYSGEAISRTRVAGHQHAQDRRLSVLLFAQPIVGMEFLSSEMVMQQGLGNRFLYSKPLSLVGSRELCSTELEDEPVYQRYCDKITVLANQQWSIDPVTGGVQTRTVRMSPGAKTAWASYHNKLERKVGPGGELAAHVGYGIRYAEQVMRMAALLAIAADPNVQAIEEETMLRAIELGDYYLGSALEMFDATPANKDEMDANCLLEWMKNTAAAHQIAAIPVRMMYKDGPRCARPSKRTRELLIVLVERGEIVEYKKAVIYGGGKRSGDNYVVM